MPGVSIVSGGSAALTNMFSGSLTDFVTGWTDEHVVVLLITVLFFVLVSRLHPIIMDMIEDPINPIDNLKPVIARWLAYVKLLLKIIIITLFIAIGQDLINTSPMTKYQYIVAIVLILALLFTTVQNYTDDS
jgi:hypothetical protein